MNDCRQGHLAMVVYLMSAGANAQLADGEGYTSLHLAAQFAHAPILGYLLAKGADPDVRDKNGMVSFRFCP